MKRRQFLFASLGAASGLITAGYALAQVAPPRRKVLIIGAGLSGLIAGYELDKKGFDVAIFEAQSRPGGRVLTFRQFDEGLYADAGAARIPRDHDLTLKYVNEFSLPLLPFYPAENKFVRVRGDRVEQVDWGKFKDATSTVMPLRNPEFWQKIKGGNDLLPHAFAAKLRDKIKYERPVVKIAQNAANVQLTVNDKGRQQTVSGDLLICAIPFTMLARIETSPAFSSPKTEAINSMEYDSASRVFIETKRRFWEDQNLNGFGFGDDAAEVWHSSFGQPATHGILQTYIRGGYSLDLTKKPELERVNSTVSKLGRLFPELQTNFVLGATKCWSDDPWVRGAWARPEDDGLVGKSREGRVFFAGEHLSDHGSWMQGALESGLRVVNEIVALPASISSAI